MITFKKTTAYLLIIVSIIFLSPILSKTSHVYAAGCTVDSATFDPYTNKGGFAQDGWYKEGSTHLTDNKVTITIKTSACAGKKINVTLTGFQTSYSGVTGGLVEGFTRDVDVLEAKEYTVPSTELITIDLIAGEESCKFNILPWNTGIGGVSDCQFKIKVSTGFFSSDYDSRDKPKGNLDYECADGCDTDTNKWIYAGDSITAYEADPASIPPKNTTTVTLGDVASSSTSPQCVDANGNAIEGCYQLYSGFADALKGRFDNITSIGDFINAIIALAIGIAGIATVGAIMFDGFIYWRASGSGDTQGTTKVKGRIWKRLLGLLLLFSMYTLLKTINPDLLSLTPRMDAINLDVFDRSSDPNFVNNIDTINVDNITVSQADIDDPTFLTYFAHQQGSAGAASILWAAKKGYGSIPNKTPFINGNGGLINTNMQKNYPCSGNVTPANFVDCWAKKVKAVKQTMNSSTALTSDIETALSKAATDTGVDVVTLRTICRIEAFPCKTNNITVVNSYGYAGLFQLSNQVYQKRTAPGVWEMYKKPNGVLLSAYDNAYVAGKYASINLSVMESYQSDING